MTLNRAGRVAGPADDLVGQAKLVAVSMASQLPERMWLEGTIVAAAAIAGGCCEGRSGAGSRYLRRQERDRARPGAGDRSRASLVLNAGVAGQRTNVDEAGALWWTPAAGREGVPRWVRSVCRGVPQDLVDCLSKPFLGL